MTSLYDESDEAEKVELKKRGRPAYLANDKDYAVVRALAVGKGKSHEYIANYIGISRNTLYKRYGQLLKDSKYDRIEEVENSLYLQAAVKQEFRATQYFLEKEKPEKYAKNQQAEVNEEFAQDLLRSVTQLLPD